MNKKIMGIIYLIVSYLIFFAAIKILPFLHFSYDLLFLFSIFNLFVFLHFIIDIKKIWNFMYEKRYFIGAFVLIILVLGKYNGSSSEIWNNSIQPNNLLDGSIILGKERPIRSDEWLVSTPMALTQSTKLVNFSKNNVILGAKDNNVTLYPNLASKDVSILAIPGSIGYLFLDVERAYSLSWYLPYFILFFSSFELFMILINKNKLLSLLGAVMITLSPVVQWWQSASIIAYGNLAIVLFYYGLKSSSWKKKLIWSLLLGYSGFLYIMCMYPAWQIPYGYCYLILVIWVLVKCKENLKIKDLLYLIPIFFVIGLLMFLIFRNNLDVLEIVNNTVYPGERFSSGGGEWRLLFTYLAQMYFPYKEVGNPCELSQYISLFPVPLIYGIYLMIKNKKKDLFIILASIITILLFIWICFPLPRIFSRITLIYMSTTERAQVAVGFLSIIEFIYIIANYSNNIKNLKKILISFAISFIVTFISIKISNNVFEDIVAGYVNLYTSVISLIIFMVIIALFLINNKKTNYILVTLLFLISIISGTVVSPINKGLKVYYNKPVSKEIRKIANENENAVFIAVNSGITLPNYIATNGVKVVNTVNQVPNLDLYYKLDPLKKYADVYNRYEHVAVNLTDQDTNFVLVQDDYITINLNYADVCKTKADYIITLDQSDAFNNYNLIYEEDGIRIFESGCEN